MTAIVKARTARVAHFCESCHWVASLCSVETIAPGHRYLLHTAFPDHEYINTKAPHSAKECVACAVERGVSYLANACETYCHGDIPCARPIRHDGDHSCRRCFLDGATAPGEATT